MSDLETGFKIEGKFIGNDIGISGNDLHWVAGFLEGEGWFTRSGRYDLQVGAAQLDREPLDKLLKIVGIGTIRFRISYGKRKDKGIYVWSTGSKRAALLMKVLYPLMSKRRQERIEKLLNEWDKRLIGRSLSQKPRNIRKRQLYLQRNGLS